MTKLTRVRSEKAFVDEKLEMFEITELFPGWEKKNIVRKKTIVCLGFYVVSTVFQLFNGDSSRYLTATVHKSMFPGLVFQPGFDQSIILTLAGQS